MKSVAFVGSLAAIGYGLHQLHPPLCPLGIGTIVLCLMVYGHVRR